MKNCHYCGGTKRVLNPNVSEGMLGTFSDAEIQLLCTVPCPCTQGKCIKCGTDTSSWVDAHLGRGLCFDCFEEAERN